MPSALQQENKFCITCKTDNTTKWYSGPLCSICYGKKYYNEHKIEKNLKWYKWARTLKGQYTTSKLKAIRLNQEWNLSLEQYNILRNQSCFYCEGNLPETNKGLDRIDNAKGYTIDNCLPCCTRCNRVRGDNLTVEETKEVIKLLKKLRGKENIWDM